MNRIALFLLTVSCAFGMERLQGDCMQGGHTVSLNGLNSSTRVMQSYVNLTANIPVSGCTVTVYVTGTVNKATLYSDNLMTPLANPLTASATGHWFFYAANGRYDITMSGAGIATPFTLEDVLAQDNGSGATSPAFYVSSDFNWSQMPGGTVSIGANTVTLTPCPLGINGSTNPNPTYVYLSGGTGSPTAEAQLITGGNCTSGSASGTITFTAGVARTGSWSVGTASTGLQESINYNIVASYVLMPYGNLPLYAPVTVSTRVSLRGGGKEITTLQNMSATTGALRMIGTNIRTPNTGMTWSDFTVYSGSLNNTAADTNAADGIYILDGWDDFVLQNVSVRNHNRGIHVVNGYRLTLQDLHIKYVATEGVRVENDGAVGSGEGADIYMSNIFVDNNGATGSLTSGGCGFSFPSWSGIYASKLISTSTKVGLCLVTRATHTPETSTQIFYGGFTDSFFDSSQETGIILDGTNGQVTALEFTHVYAAFSGCITGANCISSPFGVAAPGWWFKGTNGGSNLPTAIHLVNCEARENGGHGYLVDAGAVIDFTASAAYANSQAATNTYDGFHISANVSSVSVTDSPSTYFASNLSRVQRYGAWIANSGNSSIQITNNKFFSANASGTIFPSPALMYSNSVYFSGNLPLDQVPVWTGTLTFATLGVPGQSGWAVTCSDCKETNPCVGGGSGISVLAKWSAGQSQWNCAPYSQFTYLAQSPDVASATTITPTGQLFSLTGSTLVTTMNLPTNFVQGQVCIIDGGTWTMNTSGNFASVPSGPTTANVYCFFYSSALSKWLYQP